MTKYLFVHRCEYHAKAHEIVLCESHVGHLHNALPEYYLAEDKATCRMCVTIDHIALTFSGKAREEVLSDIDFVRHMAFGTLFGTHFFL